MIRRHQHDDTSTKSAAAPSEPSTSPEGSSEHRAHSSEHATRRILRTAAIVAAVLLVLLIISFVIRWRHKVALDKAAEEAANAPPRVIVVTARLETGQAEQSLPGNSQAYREAALYPRTNGYLKEWLVDIGDHVKEGQLIAVISAPDLDDQLAQARANLQQARATLKLNQANADLAEKTMARYKITQQQNVGAVAELLIDQQRAAVLASKASVTAAEASIGVNEAMVQMYADLQAYEKITAPFNGVITARNVDPGALVTADNPSATRELFHIMQTDPLRVFVDVPQRYSTGISIGQSADVYRPENPAKMFHGKVTRTANALDPTTRTLLTQVDVPNPDDALRPGMYLMVKFIASRPNPTVTIPSAALVTRDDGHQEVSVVDSNNIVHYRKVELGRDDGAEVEIVSGVEGGETVAVHPGDALPDKQQIKPLPKEEKSNDSNDRQRENAK